MDKLLEDQDWVQPAELGEGSTLAPCLLAWAQPLGREGIKQPLTRTVQNLPLASSSTVEWSIGKWQTRKPVLKKKKKSYANHNDSESFLLGFLQNTLLLIFAYPAPLPFPHRRGYLGLCLIQEY